jgi:hypothetical protein
LLHVQLILFSIWGTNETKHAQQDGDKKIQFHVQDSNSIVVSVKSVCSVVAVRRVFRLAGRRSGRFGFRMVELLLVLDPDLGQQRALANADDQRI